MDLSTLSPGPRKNRKRVGRGPGSGTGKTSGRGHKGQKSRSGYSRRFGFEGGQMPLMRRLPKRGFHHAERHPMAEVNVDILEAAFEAGAEVNAEELVKRGLAKSLSGCIKVVGRGELTKTLTLKVNAISPGARAKVESAGGAIELLEAPVARAVKLRKKKKSGDR